MATQACEIYDGAYSASGMEPQLAFTDEGPTIPDSDTTGLLTSARFGHASVTLRSNFNTSFFIFLFFGSISVIIGTVEKSRYLGWNVCTNILLK